MDSIYPNIHIKRLHQDAVLPSKATAEDIGFDLFAIDDGVFYNYDDEIIDEEKNEKNVPLAYVEYRTGISIQPPNNDEHGVIFTEIFPRSSITKKQLILANSIGLVDNGYRGELKVRFRFIHIMGTGSLKELRKVARMYSKGDRIAQLVVRRAIDVKFTITEELSTTSRGVGGFGSTGE